MIGNGLNIARSSARAAVSICSTTLTTRSTFYIGKYALPDLLFICRSCRVRAYSKVQSNSRFQDSVERLEKHVQVLEIKYRDILRQKAVEAASPALEVTDEITKEAYAALMSPDTNASLLPLPPKPLASRLPEPIVLRLGESLTVAEQLETPPFEPILKDIQSCGGFTGLSSNLVNRMIMQIQIPERARLGRFILDMMEESSVNPDTLTYDLIMLATAAMKDADLTKALFTEMKAKGLSKTIYSYGHLLLALSHTKDVEGASAAFQEMHAEGIKPNLIVYTSLIKTCVNRHELATAWEIFNLLKYRSTETAPDANTYSLMIHACACRGEAERALNLFNEMSARNIVPDKQVFNAMIHSCAVRKDYFLEAWRYAIEMQQQGMEIDLRTLNLLLQACGKVGELIRSRVLIRHMIASGVPELQPDERSFHMLFRAYATKTCEKLKLAGESSQLEFPKLGKHALSKIAQDELSKLPFHRSQSLLDTRQGILSEAKAMLHYIRTYKPQFYSTKLLNAYMDVLLNHMANKDLRYVYSRLFYNPRVARQEDETWDYILKNYLSQKQEQERHGSKQEHPVSDFSNDASEDELAEGESAEEDNEEGELYPWGTEEDSFKPTRNIYTFEIVLECCRRQRNIGFARKVWADRIEFTRTLEYCSLLPREQRQADFYAEKVMIDILAKSKRCEEALERLEALRHEYEFSNDDLKTLYNRAVQLEKLDVIHRLNKIMKLNESRW